MTSPETINEQLDRKKEERQKANKPPRGSRPRRGLLGFNTELRRYRAFPWMIVAVLVIPLIYGAVFLWSFWDATDNVQGMKVAVVNEDKPVQSVQGETVNAGQQVVDNLEKNENLTWIVTDASDAAQGLASGDYYATVTVPENFSESIATIATDKPVRANLLIDYNDASGGTARTILSTAMQQVQAKVSANIGAAAGNKVFLSYNTINDGIGRAVAGSTQISDGVKQLQNGVKNQFIPGVDKLQSRVSGELASGTSQLNTQVSGELSAGSAELNRGVSQDLVSGVNRLEDGAGQVAQGNKELHQGLVQLQQRLGVIASNPLIGGLPEVQEMVNGVAQLESGAQRLAAGSQTLHQGTKEAQAKVNNQLVPGVNKLNSGIQNQLVPGVQKLDSGVQNDLVPGIAELKQGALQVEAGTQALADGSVELKNGLVEAQKQIPTYDSEAAAANGDLLANSVGMDEEYLHKQQNYGAGLAPYFAPMALFVGGIFIWQALRPINRRNLAAPITATKAVIHNLSPGLLLGILQVVLLLVVLKFILGVEINNDWAFAWIMLLCGIAFTAFQQTLAIVLGAGPGRFTALVFLIFNLATAGATFPTETLPQLFQLIGKALPFGYVVTGMRETIIGVPGQGFLNASIYLVVMTILSVCIAVLSASRRRVYTVRTLNPAIKIA